MTSHIPDRDGADSAAMYAAERKAAQPWDQTVMHYIPSTAAPLTPCGIDPNEWRMGATIKSTSNRDWVSCGSCLANLELRDTMEREAYGGARVYVGDSPTKDEVLQRAQEARETTAQISLKHGMALAGITPEAPKLAHEVVPDPITTDHYYGGAQINGPRLGGLIGELAKYHAARAQGLWLRMQEDPSTTNIMMTLDQFHIASLYHLWAEDASNAAAARLNTKMRWEPEELGPAIWELCLAYGIDPATIRAYKP